MDNINYEMLAKCIVDELRANGMSIVSDMDHVLISGREAAKILGVSAATVTGMRKKRKIKAVFPNKAPKYYKDEIMRYKQKKTI